MRSSTAIFRFEDPHLSDLSLITTEYSIPYQSLPVRPLDGLMAESLLQRTDMWINILEPYPGWDRVRL